MDDFKKVFEELRKQPMFIRATVLQTYQNIFEAELEALKKEYGITDEISFYAAFMKSMFEQPLKQSTEKEESKEEPKEEIKEEPKKNKDNPFGGLKMIFKPDGTIDWEVKD